MNTVTSPASRFDYGTFDGKPRRPQAQTVLNELAARVERAGVSRAEAEAAVFTADPEAVPSGTGWITHVHGVIVSVRPDRRRSTEASWSLNEFGFYSEEVDVDRLRRVAREVARDSAARSAQRRMETL